MVGKKKELKSLVGGTQQEEEIRKRTHLQQKLDLGNSEKSTS